MFSPNRRKSGAQRIVTPILGLAARVLHIYARHKHVNTAESNTYDGMHQGSPACATKQDHPGDTELFSVECVMAGRMSTLYSYARKGDAGLDLRADITEPVALTPGTKVQFGTGLRVHLKSPGLVGLVFPRSGLGMRGIVLTNTVGVIDSNYTGEIKLSLTNTGAETVVVQPGDRIAQLVVVKIERLNLVPVEKLPDTERGESGFGSSGIS